MRLSQPAWVQAALAHLGLRAERPSLVALNRFQAAYTRRVPWESASRIARRHQVADLAARPRWPEQFWHEAARLGTGGTCFESNYACIALLQVLGYDGYLTLNNMGDTVGCHTACIIHLDGRPYLVDAGFPFPRALPLDPTRTVRIYTPLRTFWVCPDGPGRYQIDFTTLHRRNAFTLLDQPVTDADYRAATTRDYDMNGLFLDSIVIQKVSDGRIWRFSSSDHPDQLLGYTRGEKTEISVPPERLTATLAAHFALDADVLASAFAALAQTQGLR